MGIYWIPLSPGVFVPDGALEPMAIVAWPAWVAASLCLFRSASASFSDSISATILSISDCSRFCDLVSARLFFFTEAKRGGS